MFREVAVASMFRLLITVLLLGQCWACGDAGDFDCRDVDAVVLKLVLDDRAAPQAGVESCRAAVKGDFDLDGREDTALAVSPRGRDLYVYVAYNLPRGWHIGMLHTRRGFDGDPALRVIAPGHYETHAPGNRELDPGERLELDTRFPGLLLSFGHGPRLAFFFGEEAWEYVRLPPE